MLPRECEGLRHSPICWCGHGPSIFAPRISSGWRALTRSVFLFDEIEAHLHPRWQRAVVPAVLKVMDTLSDAHDPRVQLLAATHSPLVLASLEPLFEEDRDRLFHLDVRQGQVHLEEEHWAKQGDVVNWLVSETFGLRQGRSIDAERAIEAAEALMRDDTGGLPEGLRSRDEIQRELERVLAGHDPFWPRWIVHSEQIADAVMKAGL